MLSRLTDSIEAKIERTTKKIFFAPLLVFLPSDGNDNFVSIKIYNYQSNIEKINRLN